MLEMALRTGPLSEEELTDRLELETRAGERNLAAEERLRLIAESILSMEYGYLAGRDKGIRASISAVLQLLMIVGILASIIMWSAWMNPIRPTATPPFPLWELVVSGLTAIIALVVIYRMIADHRAGARGNLGLLGRSLAPLKPEREELETALKALRARKVEFARNLSLSDVVAAVERG